jgi:hypothetical protein
VVARLEQVGIERKIRKSWGIIPRRLLIVIAALGFDKAPAERKLDDNSTATLHHGAALSRGSHMSPRQHSKRGGNAEALETGVVFDRELLHRGCDHDIGAMRFNPIVLQAEVLNFRWAPYLTSESHLWFLQVLHRNSFEKPTTPSEAYPLA